MRNITHTAQHVAEICEQKNAAYGDSVAASAEALKLLYPHGLRPGQYLDAIFAARDFDKRSRLAQGDGSGENPRLDIAGYALLALHHSENQRKAPAPCASVNEDAAKRSQATLASVERRAKPLMPLSSDAIDASKNWGTPERLCAAISASASTRPANAPAPTAPTPASAAAAASAAARRSLRRDSICALGTAIFVAISLGEGFFLSWALENISDPISLMFLAGRSVFCFILVVIWLLLRLPEDIE